LCADDFGKLIDVGYRGCFTETILVRWLMLVIVVVLQRRFGTLLVLGDVIGFGRLLWPLTADATTVNIVNIVILVFFDTMSQVSIDNDHAFIPTFLHAFSFSWAQLLMRWYGRRCIALPKSVICGRRCVAWPRFCGKVTYSRPWGGCELEIQNTLPN